MTGAAIQNRASWFYDLVPPVTIHRLRERHLISGDNPGSGHHVAYSAVDARVIRFVGMLRRHYVILSKAGGDGGAKAWKHMIHPVACALAMLDDQPRWIICINDVVTSVDDVDDLVGLVTHAGCAWVIPTESWW